VSVGLLERLRRTDDEEIAAHLSQCHNGIDDQFSQRVHINECKVEGSDG
jgi:hypothetical protein